MVKFRSKDGLQLVCYEIHGVGHLLKYDVLKALRKVVRSRKRSKYPLRVGLGLIVKNTRKKSPSVVRSLLAVVLACHCIRQRMVGFLPAEEVVSSLCYDVEWNVVVLERRRKTALGIIVPYSPTIWSRLFHRKTRRGDGVRE